MSANQNIPVYTTRPSLIRTPNAGNTTIFKSDGTETLTMDAYYEMLSDRSVRLLFQPGGAGFGGPKIYKATINQSGISDPVAEVLANTLGNVVWTRNNVGLYIGTLLGAFPTSSRVFLMTGNFTSGIAISSRFNSFAGLTYGDVDTVVLECQSKDVPADGLFSDLAVLIEVY